MKKIVIFGATGNIGAYFTDYCMSNIDNNEYSIIAVGRKKTDFFQRNGIDYYRLDISDKREFDKLPQDNVFAIVNLAGILPAYSSCNDPYLYINTNVVGGINILEYARKVKADRVLYAQTWAEQAGFWDCFVKTAEKLGVDGEFNVFANAGVNAPIFNQSVFHFHLHLISGKRTDACIGIMQEMLCQK